MAREFDNTDRGALFKNDRKESEKHPDYTGNINVGGADYWLNAWLKKSKAGATFMSLSVKIKEPKPAQEAAPEGDLPFNDEIPF